MSNEKDVEVTIKFKIKRDLIRKDLARLNPATLLKNVLGISREPNFEVFTNNLFTEELFSAIQSSCEKKILELYKIEASYMIDSISENAILYEDICKYINQCDVHSILSSETIPLATKKKVLASYKASLDELISEEDE
jgi:hypothetical protein